MRGRKRSLSPKDGSPQDSNDQYLKDQKYANGSDYSGSPRARSKSLVDAPEEEGGHWDYKRSAAEENGCSHSPAERDDGSAGENGNHDSPRGSE